MPSPHAHVPLQRPCWIDVLRAHAAAYAMFAPGTTGRSPHVPPSTMLELHLQPASRTSARA
eukprot:4187003-Prorocentrum_lima.AAC.1